MKCKKCGKEVGKTDAFCQYCGTEIKKEEKAKTTVAKTTEKRKEVKEEVVAEKVTTEKKSGNGLAIAGMVLGIIGIVLSLLIGPIAFLFPLLGLILSLCAKKCGFKTAGIITSIVGFVIELIITILVVVFFSAFMGLVGDYVNNYDDYNYDYDYDYNYTYKNETPYGTWKCVSYPSSDSEETTLNLKYSGRFVYGPSDDLTNNYYSGTFTYTTEYEKNKDYTDRKFIDIKAPVDEFTLDGVKQDASNKNLNMEMELIDDYDTSIIMFYNTYNTYKCER